MKSGSSPDIARCIATNATRIIYRCFGKNLRYTQYIPMKRTMKKSPVSIPTENEFTPIMTPITKSMKASGISAQRMDISNTTICLLKRSTYPK